MIFIGPFLTFLLMLILVLVGTTVLCIILCIFTGPKASTPSNTWDTLNAIHDAMKTCLKSHHTKDTP